MVYNTDCSYVMPLHGVYKGIINGLHTRGDGGFLYVKGDECAYMFPHELKNQNDTRKGIESLLQEDESCSKFYVLEERDGHAHIMAYERSTVREEVEKELYGNKNTSSFDADTKCDKQTKAHCCDSDTKVVCDEP